MPVKKKAKPKYTSGVLCRDKGRDSKVAFCKHAVREDVSLGNIGIWNSASATPANHWKNLKWKTWTIKEWKATYKLAPPRRGQAFECDVEL